MAQVTCIMVLGHSTAQPTLTEKQNGIYISCSKCIVSYHKTALDRLIYCNLASIKTLSSWFSKALCYFISRRTSVRTGL